MNDATMPDSDVQIDDAGDWYCANCDQYLSPARVTFEERCDTCGEPVGWLEYEE